MMTPPADLSQEQLFTALIGQWGLPATTVTYAPLGFGSHHWVAESVSEERWFVTVDDLRAAHFGASVEEWFRLLRLAFGMASRLRDEAGLSFVIAPVPTEAGAILHRLTDRYSMAVFPHLDVIPSEFGEFRKETDRIDALQLVARVHSATDTMTIDGVRRDTLALPGRIDLEATLEDVATSWSNGPYAEPARTLLGKHVAIVRSALETFDNLASEVTADMSRWVVTHGEPHAGNVVRTIAGDLMMVDWDTVALASPERDLRMLVSEEHPDWSAYHEITGLRALSREAMGAYRLHWALSEIAVYLAWFRRPHNDTEDMRIAWEGLQGYLAEVIAIST